jgi:ABC-2 type transport system ATP-binding protein
MLTVHSSRSTVTGLALAENKEKLTAAGAVCENPTLQQLSVELLKMAEE